LYARIYLLPWNKRHQIPPKSREISEILHGIVTQKTVIITITDEGTSNHLTLHLLFLCLFIAQVLAKVKQYSCIPKYLVRFQEGMSTRLTDISCDFPHFVDGKIGVVPWNRPRPPHSKPYVLIIRASSCLIQHCTICVPELVLLPRWLGCLACSHSELILKFESYRQSAWLLGRVISPSQGRYLHRTTQTMNKRRHTSTIRAGFEPTTWVFGRAKKFRALDGAASVIGVDETVSQNNFRLMFPKVRAATSGRGAKAISRGRKKLIDNLVINFVFNCSLFYRFTPNNISC
jgi:hypothetical protein